MVSKSKTELQVWVPYFYPVHMRFLSLFLQFTSLRRVRSGRRLFVLESVGTPHNVHEKLHVELTGKERRERRRRGLLNKDEHSLSLHPSDVQMDKYCDTCEEDCKVIT